MIFFEFWCWDDLSWHVKDIHYTVNGFVYFKYSALVSTQVVASMMENNQLQTIFILFLFCETAELWESQLNPYGWVQNFSLHISCWKNWRKIRIIISFWEKRFCFIFATFWNRFWAYLKILKRIRKCGYVSKEIIIKAGNIFLRKLYLIIIYRNL